MSRLKCFASFVVVGALAGWTWSMTGRADAAERVPSPSPPAADIGSPEVRSDSQSFHRSSGGWRGAYGRAVVGAGASAMPGPVCPSCLPYRTPWPCGVGPSDCCVNLPDTGFLFYGSDPRDDDPINHTWTTCVADQGNHAARKTVRHVRRFGY